MQCTTNANAKQKYYSMKKTINPQAIEITRRFFQALNLAIELGKVDGVKGFCEAHNLNRPKYASLKMTINKPVEEMTYKCIDVDALAGICTLACRLNGCCLVGEKCLKRTQNENKLVGQVLSL